MKAAPTGLAPVLATVWIAAACSTSGSAWMAQPLNEPDDDYRRGSWAPPDKHGTAAGAGRYQTKTIGGDEEEPQLREQRIEGEKLQGRVLGKFRNTYYDFPSEGDFTGGSVSLRNAKCEVIKQVPRGFYEAVCVQGSGLLASGQTVSFAKRDCDCADICPRTQQKICFDALDPATYPWGRGALGKPITPMLTVAVDDTQIPMGTAIYIPEYDGLPRDPDGSSAHDGCFIAQDRGKKVAGQHVDIFTGQAALTQLWNRLVPSNQGVTVIADSPRCARAP